MNFTQDFFVMAGTKRNTLRFTADLYNMGNLLNKTGDYTSLPSARRCLYEGLVAPVPENRSNPNAGKQTPLSSTFQNNTSLASRWQMQLGIRYIFN